MRWLPALLVCFATTALAADIDNRRTLATKHFSDDVQRLEGDRVAMQQRAAEAARLCDTIRYDTLPNGGRVRVESDGCADARAQQIVAELAIVHELTAALELARRGGVSPGTIRGLLRGSKLEALRDGH